jgi:hypothetical protein
VSPGVAQLLRDHYLVEYLVVSRVFLIPAKMSILIEFVSSRFFLFKLAHGLYVIVPFRFGNVLCLTHASPSFSQPSHLFRRSSRPGTITPWNRIRRSKRRLLE